MHITMICEMIKFIGIKVLGVTSNMKCIKVLGVMRDMSMMINYVVISVMHITMNSDMSEMIVISAISVMHMTDAQGRIVTPGLTAPFVLATAIMIVAMIVISVIVIVKIVIVMIAMIAVLLVVWERNHHQVKATRER